MALVSDKNWSEGVYMALGKLGEYRVVSSTREAADILLYKWPVGGGDAYTTALLVCQNVMEGTLPPDEAKHAFILAAEEAGIFIAEKLPRNLTLVLPEPGAKKTDMRFYPKKRGHRTYRR